MPTIYPILKPFDWANKALVEHIPVFLDVEKAPLIAFGFDAGNHYQFVQKGEVNDFKALFAEGLKNLAALDYPWEVSGAYAFSSGKEFSAERVLDRGAMLECQRLLGVNKIIVTAPRRTCLFATAYPPSRDALQPFLALINATYHDDSYGHAPISQAFYTVENGSIVKISFAAQDMQAFAPSVASTAPGASGAPQASQPLPKEKYLDPNSQAGNPGGIALSLAKLRVLQPQLFPNGAPEPGDTRIQWQEAIAVYLQSGDCQPAIVMDANAGIVAVYADELDCVVLLKFDPYFARASAWQTGMRLLSVNVYTPREKGIASDIRLGPKEHGNWSNFLPLIADLLTDDLGRVASQKASIPEAEWSRLQELSQKLFADKTALPRDGRPLTSGTPAVVKGAASSAVSGASARASTGAAATPRPAGRARRPGQAAARFHKGLFAGALVGLLLAGTGVGLIGTISNGVIFYFACLGIVCAGLVGLLCGKRFWKGMFPGRA